MASTKFSHTSVLLYECIDSLNIRDGYTYVDCTAGGGGHSLEIAKRLGPNSRLICFDRDQNAIAAATERLSDYLDKVTFVNENFSSIGAVLDDMHITNLGGVLADLGCSSHQFDMPERGFSYMHDSLLDMRMDVNSPLTAYTVVNTYSEDALKRIIFEYGEERYAHRIASAIIAKRTVNPIKTTLELSEIIKNAIPMASKIHGPHPSKRTFQAIRIEVNGELDAIPPLITDATLRLAKTGRVAIISFHSLEDRLVKQGFKELSKGCTCPKDFPICICGNKPSVKEITKKPILPTEEELEANPRARSAKLRVAEKL